MPFIIIGDLNSIHQATDRINRAEVIEVETQDLSNFILDAQVLGVIKVLVKIEFQGN